MKLEGPEEVRMQDASKRIKGAVWAVIIDRNIVYALLSQLQKPLSR
jgi:hypothetical protein